MKQLEVRVAPIANRLVLDQVLYIAQDSIQNALAWEDRCRVKRPGG
jgi:hypothetical protein